MKAVFFDAVGTVIFPAVPAARVYAETAKRHGLAADPSEIGPRMWAQFRLEEKRDRELGWATSEAREQERWRNIVFAAIDGATEDLFLELYLHFAKPSAWMVPPAAVECFARLQSRGVRLGMGSNYDSRLASVVAGTPGLAPLAERLVISSLVGTRKPGRTFFDQVVRTAGLEASEILFVGDDVENDFEGAIAAGLQAVLVDEDGKHPHITPRVSSLAELL